MLAVSFLGRPDRKMCSAFCKTKIKKTRRTLLVRFPPLGLKMKMKKAYYYDLTTFYYYYDNDIFADWNVPYLKLFGSPLPTFFPKACVSLRFPW